MLLLLHLILTVIVLLCRVVKWLYFGTIEVPVDPVDMVNSKLYTKLSGCPVDT